MATSTSVFTIAAISVPLILGWPAPVGNPHTTVKVKAGQLSNVVSGSGAGLAATYSVGQSYFWTGEWQNQETLAAADLREGRYQDFDSAEEAIAWLFDDEA